MKYLLCFMLVSSSAFGIDLFANQKSAESNLKEIDSVSFGDCDVTAMISRHEKRAVLKFVTFAKRTLVNNLVSCTVSKDQYAEALKQLASKIKKHSISELVTGYDKNPADDEWKLKLALASVKNEKFRKILREGEKEITLNEVFAEIVKENKVFDSFIELHKLSGLNLEFARVEKVFREVVKTSPDREMMRLAGLKDQQKYISGAGIISFKVK